MSVVTKVHARQVCRVFDCAMHTLLSSESEVHVADMFSRSSTLEMSIGFFFSLHPLGLAEALTSHLF
jgi:hypothetical protein